MLRNFLEHLETSPIEISATDLDYFVRSLENLIALSILMGYGYKIQESKDKWSHDRGTQKRYGQDLDKGIAKVRAAAEETSKTDVMVLAIITGSKIAVFFQLAKFQYFVKYKLISFSMVYLSKTI